MTIRELLLTTNGEPALWLAGLAAIAGLALAWRLWAGPGRRVSRVLGRAQSPAPGCPSGLRYVGLVGVAVLTVFALTPTEPGRGDVEPVAQEVVPGASPTAPNTVVIELGGSEAAITIQGSTVTVRLNTTEPMAASTAVATGPQRHGATSTPAAVVYPATDPAGME